MTDIRYQEGLLGRKLGMTQVFTSEGESIPVTALEVGPCYILQVKTMESDGYKSVQLGFAPKKAQRVDKARSGHFSKAGKGAFYHVKEIRCDIDSLGWNELGKELTADAVFAQDTFVDVTGVSIGRGFSGVFRRYGMDGQPGSRGTHEVRRHVGSIGCRKSPGRVFKNKHLPGHYGNDKVTVQNLKVVQVLPEKNVILVRGAVPGSKGGFIVIKKAMKKGSVKAAA